MVYTSRWLSGTCIPIIRDVRLCVTSRNVIYEADLVKMKGRGGPGSTGLRPPCKHPRLYGGWEVNISMILLMAPETFLSFESIAFIQLDKPQLCSSQTKLQYMIKQEPQALPKKTNTIKGPVWAPYSNSLPQVDKTHQKNSSLGLAWLRSPGHSACAEGLLISFGSATCSSHYHWASAILLRWTWRTLDQVK